MGAFAAQESEETQESMGMESRDAEGTTGEGLLIFRHGDTGLGTPRCVSRLGPRVGAMGITNSVLDTEFPQDERTRNRDVS